MKVLIVDDLAIYRSLFSMALELGGAHCETCANGWQAIEQLGTKGLPDLLVIDYTLPDAAIEVFLRAVRIVDPDQKVPVLLMVSTFDPDCLLIARDFGIHNIFLKGDFYPQLFRDKCRLAVEGSSFDRELERLARHIIKIDPIAERLQKEREAKASARRREAAKAEFEGRAS